MPTLTDLADLVAPPGPVSTIGWEMPAGLRFVVNTLTPVQIAALGLNQTGLQGVIGLAFSSGACGLPEIFVRPLNDAIAAEHWRHEIGHFGGLWDSRHRKLAPAQQDGRR